MGRFKKDKNFAGNSRGFGKSKDSGKKEFDMKNFDRRGSRSSRDNGPHEVICAKCGIHTDVPFKPTTNKPVYCRDCFKRQDTADERRSSSFSKRGSERSFQPQRDARPSDDGLAAINRKLDKIMEALEIDDE
jgi:CxxC-x17-CxxC domain-containing protein